MSAQLLRLLFEHFENAFSFTAADLLTPGNLALECALIDCVGAHATVQTIGHYLQSLDGVRFEDLELKGVFDSHVKRCQYTVAQHAPLTPEQKAELLTQLAAQPHEVPTGVRQLKRLSKHIEETHTERQQTAQAHGELMEKFNPGAKMETTTDWLGEEDDPFADPDAPKTDLVAKESQELVEHVEALTIEQRDFLEILVSNRYDAVEARREYRDTHGGNSLPVAMLSCWMADPDFVAAVTKREAIAARLHRVSAAQVLADLADIKRRNIGKNDRLALSALELISKALGMFQKDPDKQDVRVGPALVIQLMQRDGTVITVGAGGAVLPDLPPPEKLVNP